MGEEVNWNPHGRSILGAAEAQPATGGIRLSPAGEASVKPEITPTRCLGGMNGHILQTAELENANVRDRGSSSPEGGQH